MNEAHNKRRDDNRAPGMLSWEGASEHGSGEMSAAARDVLAERRRQVEDEGRTDGSDDVWVCEELAAYAALYAMPPACREWTADSTGYGESWADAILPEGWTPPKFGDRRRELVKAGALILAEIERLDRAVIAANKDGA